MQPMSHRRRNVYFYSLCAIFVLAIPLLILYAEGYHLTKNWQISETGGIYVYTPQAGSSIYLNGEKVEEGGTFQRGLLLPNLKPGTYNILVSKVNFSSWKKTIEVQSGYVSEAYPFMLSNDLTPVSVTPFLSSGTATTTSAKLPNPEYKIALALFATSTPQLNGKVSTSTEDIIHGNLILSREQGGILAEWAGRLDSAPFYFCLTTQCVATTTVVTSISPIFHFDFLPGRDDVMVIAEAAGLFAVEFDPRPPQNIVEFVRGKNLDFRILNKTIYIKTGTQLSKIDF